MLRYRSYDEPRAAVSAWGLVWPTVARHFQIATYPSSRSRHPSNWFEQMPLPRAQRSQALQTRLHARSDGALCYPSLPCSIPAISGIRHLRDYSLPRWLQPNLKARLADQSCEPRQRQTDLGNADDQQQPCEQGQHVGQVGAEMLADVQFRKTQRHQKSDAHWRKKKTDPDRGGLHDIEMNGVDAHGF